MTQAAFAFDNSFARDMEGFYIPWQGEVAPQPKMLAFNAPLAQELGLDPEALSGEDGAQFFSGSEAPVGASPLAQVYAGHQFGHLSPQLGDGRALLLGEVIDAGGIRRDIQLKGSGRTPFSRGGDGKAVLGPVLREYLMGEAMHALGIPTTRALAAVTTGEEVMREAPQQGAVLTRVASSHLRVGTFVFFAARGEQDKVRQLADYAIARHYPHLAETDTKYLALLNAVIDAQVALIAQWQAVGFIHGVMNTDNMTICGETIDYGPCAFMDTYDPATVFSSIDRAGRYAFGNQPRIAAWNLARFAETLLPLIDADEDVAVRLATDAVSAVSEQCTAAWLTQMQRKIGLTPKEDDTALVAGLLDLMTRQKVDYTSVFRRLGQAAQGDTAPLEQMFEDAAALNDWLAQWTARSAREPQAPPARRAAMEQVNPVYIPRNHLVEDVLASADGGDMDPFHAFVALLLDPYSAKPGFERFERPAPGDFGPYRTYCGT